DPALPEPIRGPQGAKDNFKQYSDAFEGAQITVVDQIAEGDAVATRWQGRGRHTGELMGFPPTGKEVIVEGLNLTRLRDGKIVEEWSNWDTLGMLQHVGERGRLLDYQMFQLRDEVAAVESELGAYLDSPSGRFELWWAERERRRRGAGDD